MSSQSGSEHPVTSTIRPPIEPQIACAGGDGTSRGLTPTVTAVATSQLMRTPNSSLSAVTARISVDCGSPHSSVRSNTRNTARADGSRLCQQRTFAYRRAPLPQRTGAAATVPPDWLVVATD